MAERSQSLIDELRQMTQCPVCLDDYTDPRGLPCQHALCQRCLQEVIDRAVRTFNCPSCRASLPIPVGKKADAFPPAIFVNNLFDTLKSIEQKDPGTSGCVTNSASKEAANRRLATLLQAYITRRFEKCRTDGLNMVGDVLSYTAKDNRVAVYRSATPLVPDQSYFQFEIVDSGEHANLAIGLVPHDYPLNRQPGWDAYSIGYHADDGSLFVADGRGMPFGPVCKTGDVMGCGINFGEQSDEDMAAGIVKVYFTKNDDKIGEQKIPLPSEGLYPAVGMHSMNEKVRLGRRHTALCDWWRAPRLVRLDGVSVVDNTISYIGCDGRVGLYQAAQPLSASNRHFEIEILDTGGRGAIAIGVVPGDYPLCNQPGWRHNSIAYHGDDGRLFHESGFPGEPFGPVCKTGDRMGCYIDLPFDQAHHASSGELENTMISVHFTHNGSEIGARKICVPTGGLFPAVGLHYAREKVRINLENTSSGLVEATVIQEFMESVNSGRILHKSKCEGIKLKNSNHILKYNDKHGRVGTFMYKEPMSARRHYFEIEILNTGHLGTIAIGLVTRNHPNGSQPGWAAYSVGYHADDGNLFEGVGHGKPFGTTCKAGDKMGCGISFNNIHTGDLINGMMSVFFTRNGVQIGSTSVPIPEGGFYPAVGMHSEGESVRLFV